MHRSSSITESKSERKGIPISIPQVSSISSRDYNPNWKATGGEMNNFESGSNRFSEPDVMLVPINPRCYRCGKVIKQTLLEDALLSGLSIVEAGEKQGLVRQCCQAMIQTSVPLVQLRKMIQREEETNKRLVEAVGYPPPTEFINYFEPTSMQIKIIDHVPSSIHIGNSFADVQRSLGIPDNSEQIEEDESVNNISMAIQSLNLPDGDED